MFAIVLTRLRMGLLLLIHVLLAFLPHQSDAVNCQYSKQKGLHTADCADRKLRDVPKNLRSEIEVLDLSNNAIRELRNESFTCCTSIKLLYLQSNSIFDIDSHAFAPLTSLTALDLSLNVLSVIPRNLPSSLMKLFLDQNPTLFLSMRDNPVVSLAGLTSLDTLHLSGNRLSKFPKFNGSVPSLVKLNITDNDFSEISVDDLASLCQLKYLYVKTDKLFQPSSRGQMAQREFCMCIQLESWTRTHEIEVYSFVCKKEKFITYHCDTEAKNTTIAAYDKCLAVVDARKLPYKLMVGSGIVALLIGIVILLYLRHRRQEQEKSGGTSNHKSRTPCHMTPLDNKALEDKCTNHAFENYRIQHISPPPWERETEV